MTNSLNLLFCVIIIDIVQVIKDGIGLFNEERMSDSMSIEKNDSRGAQGCDDSLDDSADASGEIEKFSVSDGILRDGNDSGIRSKCRAVIRPGTNNTVGDVNGTKVIKCSTFDICI